MGISWRSLTVWWVATIWWVTISAIMAESTIVATYLFIYLMSFESNNGLLKLETKLCELTAIYLDHHIHHQDHHSIHIRMRMMLSSLDLQRRLLLVVLIRDWPIVGVERAQSVWVVVHQLEWLPHKQRWQRRRQSCIRIKIGRDKKQLIRCVRKYRAWNLIWFCLWTEADLML